MSRGRDLDCIWGGELVDGGNGGTLKTGRCGDKGGAGSSDLTEPAGTSPSGRDEVVETKHGRYPHWLIYVSWGVSIAALAYVLSRLQLSQLRKDLPHITWWLVALAVIVEIVPRLLEAVRWQYLLKPLATRFHRLLQAIYVGTLYSAVLPFSGGDAVRGVIVARQTRASVTRVLTTELVERVADAIAIILAAWFALRGLAVPYALRVALIVLEAGAGVAVVAGSVMAAQQVNLLARLGSWQPARRIWKGVRSVALDLVQAAGRVRLQTMIAAIAAGLASTALNILAYWLILRAYHINLSLLQSAALFAIVMIGTFLPGPPGNVGSWQFFCAVGLQLFGVSAARAAGYSLFAYVIWTVPPVIMGLGALFASPFTWSELTRRRARAGRST
jgi:glycosyltransferase 2 family protein